MEKIKIIKEIYSILYLDQWSYKRRKLILLSHVHIV